MVALSSELFCVICSVPGDSSKTASEVLTAHVRTIGLTNNPDYPHQLITVRRRHIWSDTKRVLGKLTQTSPFLSKSSLLVSRLRMKVDLRGSFSDWLLLQQPVILLSSLVHVSVGLYNTIQPLCFGRSFVMWETSFQCLLFRGRLHLHSPLGGYLESESV